MDFRLSEPQAAFQENVRRFAEKHWAVEQAELSRDIALRLAPVDEAAAREMIAELRALAPLAGWRNLPRGDLDALACAVVAVSRLAALEGVREAEINPLIVRAEGQGVTVADAWIVRI